MDFQPTHENCPIDDTNCDDYLQSGDFKDVQIGAQLSVFPHKGFENIYSSLQTNNIVVLYDSIRRYFKQWDLGLY